MGIAYDTCGRWDECFRHSGPLRGCIEIEKVVYRPVATSPNCKPPPSPWAMQVKLLQREKSVLRPEIKASRELELKLQTGMAMAMRWLWKVATRGKWSAFVAWASSPLPGLWQMRTSRAPIPDARAHHRVQTEIRSWMRSRFNQAFCIATSYV